jgi:hypothetical protein
MSVALHPSISVTRGRRGVPPTLLPGTIYTGLLPLQINTELFLYNLTDDDDLLELEDLL